MRRLSPPIRRRWLTSKVQSTSSWTQHRHRTTSRPTYIKTLALDGTLVSLGALGSMQFDPLALLVGRKSLASAGSGGTKGTQAMLEFAGQHGITGDIEVLPAREVDVALARLERNDVRFRFVLDMAQM